MRNYELNHFLCEIFVVLVFIYKDRSFFNYILLPFVGTLRVGFVFFFKDVTILKMSQCILFYGRIVTYDTIISIEPSASSGAKMFVRNNLREVHIEHDTERRCDVYLI